MAVYTSYCNSGSKASRYGVRLTVTQNSQSIANNTSNITCTFELGGAGALGLSTDYTGSSFSGYTCTGKIYVNGVEKASGSSSANISNSTKVTLATWTGNVTHNADGTLTIPIKGVFTGGVSSQASGGTASGNVTFTTIPRASSVSCTTANIGAKPTITITRASSSFTHTLTYNFGGLTDTIKTKTDLVSITDWAYPTSFYAKIPNANSGTGTITCTTYNGTTVIGTSTCSFTANVPSTATPTVTVPTLTDTDTVSKNTIGLYVIDKSKIQFNFANCFSSSYSATLKSYTLKINGKQVYSGTGTTYTMGTPLSSTGDKYELIITDSRGKTATTGEKTMTAYAYSSPTGSITAQRNSSTSTTIDIKYSATISNINNNGKNAKSIKIDYKTATSTTWTNVATITDSYSKSNVTVQKTGLSDSSSYNFRITIQDSYTSTTGTVDVGTTFTLINFNAAGTSLALGKASENANLFEVGMSEKVTGTLNATSGLQINGTNVLLKAYPVGSIYMSVNDTDPKDLFGGTWERIKDRFLLSAGDTYASGSTGGAASHTPSGTVGGHTLTTNEIPSHSHSPSSKGNNWVYNTTSVSRVQMATSTSSKKYLAVPDNTDANGWVWGATGSTGGGGSHNHGFTGTSQNTMPPYLTVYMWKRTA